MPPNQCVLYLDMCRICLQNKGLSVICEMHDLQQYIKHCIGIKVHSSDNMPQKICIKCCNVLQRALELKKIAKNNELILKSLLNKTMEDETLELEAKSSSSDTSHSQEHDNEAATTQYKIKVRKDLYDNTPAEAVKDRHSKKKHTAEASQVPRENTESCDSDSDGDNSQTSVCKKVRIKLENGFVMEEFECNVCHKTYETRKKLYLHKRSHNKNISCPIDACSKLFATKGDLQKHLRTHTGEKPFECDICEKKFSQQGSLKNHRNIVHFGLL